MARWRVELPETIGTASGGGSTPSLRIGRQPDGGADRPLILRWFETWATGAVREG